jgi:hypothetical protein
MTQHAPGGRTPKTLRLTDDEIQWIQDHADRWEVSWSLAATRLIQLGGAVAKVVDLSKALRAAEASLTPVRTHLVEARVALAAGTQDIAEAVAPSASDVDGHPQAAEPAQV